jgi:hypothetical protein
MEWKSIGFERGVALCGGFVLVWSAVCQYEHEARGVDGGPGRYARDGQGMRRPTGQRRMMEEVGARQEGFGEGVC